MHKKKRRKKLISSIVSIGMLFAGGFIPVDINVSAASDVVTVFKTNQDMTRLFEKSSVSFSISDGTDSSDEVINVNDKVKYQQHFGIGSSLDETSVYLLNKLSDEKRHEVLTKLVDPEKGVGYTGWRICLGTSDFCSDINGDGVYDQKDFYSYDDMPPGQVDPELKNFSIQKDIDRKIISTVKEAISINPDIKIFAAAWSAPGWMKTNDSLLVEKEGSYLKDEYIAAFAKYYRKAIQAYAQQGIPIYAVSLINEPNVGVYDYPAMGMYNYQAEILIKEMAREFEEYHIDTKIWVHDFNFVDWENESAKANWRVIEDEDIRSLVDGVAFHSYSGEPEAMGRLHDKFQIDIYHTERKEWNLSGMDRIIKFFRNYSKSYTSWVVMLDEARKVHHYHSPPGSPMISIDPADPDNSVKYNFEYYGCGHFSKYIKPGAYRIDTNPGSMDTITNVAYQNPDGSIAMVAVNQNETPQKIKVVYNGKQFTDTIEPRTIATYNWEGTQHVDIPQPVAKSRPSVNSDTFKKISVVIDHKAYKFDPAPVAVNHRTLVPMRAVFEVLGADIQWDEATGTVTAAKGIKRIVLRIGDNSAKINDGSIDLDVPPQLVEGRTMVPLRFVSEALNYNVNWIEDIGTVVISKKSALEDEDRISALRTQDDKLADLPNGYVMLTQDEYLQSKNSPNAGLYGEIEKVQVTGQSFKEALQINTRTQPANLYDVQTTVKCAAPVKKGDMLFASFYARCVSTTASTGKGYTEFITELGVKPYTNYVAADFELTTEWKKFYIPFTAKEDIAASITQIAIRGGYAPQVIEVGGMELVNFGGEVKPEQLPVSQQTPITNQVSAVNNAKTPEEILAGLPEGIVILTPGEHLLSKSSPNAGTYGEIKKVQVTGQPFTEAIQINTKTKPSKLYEIQTTVKSNVSVKKGDVLFASFYARCAGTTGSTEKGYTEFVTELGEKPYTNYVTADFELTTEWKKFYVPFIAKEDIRKSMTQITIRGGYAPQVIEVGGVELVNYGDSVEVSRLPASQKTRISSE